MKTIIAAFFSLTLAIAGCGTSDGAPLPPDGGNGDGNGQGNGNDQGNGDCYVHLFDEDDFDESDDHFRLVEPGRYGDMSDLPGATQDWGGEADSLKVGPGATVTIWSEEDFQGDSRTYEAGEQDGDLPIEARSIELSCD